MRSGSISGSSVEGQGRVQRKLSQVSAAPLARHSASVFDLNNVSHQNHPSAFHPMGQVILNFIFFTYFIFNSFNTTLISGPINGSIKLPNLLHWYVYGSMGEYRSRPTFWKQCIIKHAPRIFSNAYVDGSNGYMAWSITFHGHVPVPNDDAQSRL